MLISILLAIFALLILCGLPPVNWFLPNKNKIETEGDFLCIARTDGVKGITAIMIVFAHMFSFGDYSNTVIGG